MKELLKIKNLHTYFETKAGTIKSVNGVDLEIFEGKTLGIVGESGSGKSITALSVLRLLESPGKIVDGEIFFNNQDLTKIPLKQMQHIRGNEISMIFQEPMTSLNPVFKIGKQIAEVIMLHEKKSKKESLKDALKMLSEVGIPRPEDILNSYPHQLSGGMRQRIMIAIALACKPKLLIADEPTTALDVTIQAQILDLMNKLKKDLNTSILFITHDLGVIHEVADDVAVMYCGEVIERSSSSIMFNNPKYSHPYTEGLLNSIPKIEEKREFLEAIEGNVPHPLDLPTGCRFAPRCKYAKQKCFDEKPELEIMNENQKIRCFYPLSEDRT